MTTVTLHYFALLREQRGLSSESLTTGAATAAALYDELARRHGFTNSPRGTPRCGPATSWSSSLRSPGDSHPKERFSPLP